MPLTKEIPKRRLDSLIKTLILDFQNNTLDIDDVPVYVLNQELIAQPNLWHPMLRLTFTYESLDKEISLQHFKNTNRVERAYMHEDTYKEVKSFIKLVDIIYKAVVSGNISEKNKGKLIALCDLMGC